MIFRKDLESSLKNEFLLNKMRQVLQLINKSMNINEMIK